MLDNIKDLPTEITWVKPDGTKVITNTTEASIEAAVDLGWKQEETVVKKTVVKKKS